MRLVPSLLATALLAATLASSAGADPFTARLDALRTSMETERDGIAPDESTTRLKEKAVLTRALAAYDARSKSLDGDLKICLRVAKSIESFFTDNATPIPTALHDATAGLGDDVVAERDALAARMVPLVDAKLVAKAQAGLDEANAALTLAASAASESSRVGLFRKALKAADGTIARIDRATAGRGSPRQPGVGYFSCLVDSTPFVPSFGSGRVVLAAGDPSEVTLTGYNVPTSRGGIIVDWSTGGFLGVGRYDLDGSSGASITLLSDGRTFFSESGQVTVTLFDPAKRQIEGTFDAVVTSNDNAHRNVTRGSFRVRSYGTSGM